MKSPAMFKARLTQHNLNYTQFAEIVGYTPSGISWAIRKDQIPKTFWITLDYLDQKIALSNITNAVVEQLSALNQKPQIEG